MTFEFRLVAKTIPTILGEIVKQGQKNGKKTKQTRKEEENIHENNTLNMQKIFETKNINLNICQFIKTPTTLLQILMLSMGYKE